MSNTSTIERRLTQVEKEVSFLKSKLSGLSVKKQWIDQISGSLKNDPEFDEILRHGQQIRKADRDDGFENCFDCVIEEHDRIDS